MDGAQRSYLPVLAMLLVLVAWIGPSDAPQAFYVVVAQVIPVFMLALAVESRFLEMSGQTRVFLALVYVSLAAGELAALVVVARGRPTGFAELLVWCAVVGAFWGFAVLASESLLTSPRERGSPSEPQGPGE